MALATKCPHCNTIFRVAADQLKLRGGIVRCGSCQQVFDGNSALVEPAAKPTPVIPDVVAERAAPPHVVPAISDYVHGTPVDFELDFAEEPSPAAKAADAPPAARAAEPQVTPQPAAAAPAGAAPPAEAPAPAVWRTAAAHAPAAEPTPDDAARAAVARAFAAANTPSPAQQSAPPRPAEPSPPAHPLAALVSPDDAFSQAAGEPPASGPWTPLAPAPAAAAVPPAASPSAAIDEKLLVWEDIPANASAASDAAAMAAVARAFNNVKNHADEKKAPAQDVAPLAAEFTLSSPAPAPAFEALPPADEVPPRVENSPSASEEPAVGEEPTAADELPAADEPPAADALPAADVAASAAPESAQEESAPQNDAPAIAPDAESSVPADAAQIEATDQWPAQNAHPDGRIEPSLDTPQEHIVLAAIDDAHHFEDLPPVDQPVEEPFAAEASVADTGKSSEPSLDDKPWTAAEEASDALSPTGEPWSLSEPEPERDDIALHAVAAVNTDVPDDGESLPGDEEQAAAEAALAAARMRALAGVDEADDLDHSALSFVKRVERSQKYGKAATITMAIGIPLLLAGLALQAGTTFRDTLAANYPQLKPALAAMCQPLGCKIALPTQLDALSIEQGELATMAENTFSFSTVLRNQSKTAQAWPHIELTLNDNADKPVLRRVFAPREYLPSPAEAEKGFGPRSEQSVKLYFELKELKASGYHIAIFYP